MPARLPWRSCSGRRKGASGMAERHRASPARGPRLRVGCGWSVTKFKIAAPSGSERRKGATHYLRLSPMTCAASDIQIPAPLVVNNIFNSESTRLRSREGRRTGKSGQLQLRQAMGFTTLARIREQKSFLPSSTLQKSRYSTAARRVRGAISRYTLRPRAPEPMPGSRPTTPSRRTEYASHPCRPTRRQRQAANPRIRPVQPIGMPRPFRL